VEGRCFERFSRFWLIMGWNSCVWKLKILPENGNYEIIFGPFFKKLKGETGGFSFFGIYWEPF